MSRKLALFAALVLAGTAIAQVPPPPPPPPPSAPPSSASSEGGIVTSISFDELKAIFDAAGVPYELKAFDNGLPYLAATPEGFQMFASVQDCPDVTKPVGCTAISLESGRWSSKMTLEDANIFNSTYVAAKAFLTKDGEPGLIYSFSLNAGVSSTFVRWQLKGFVSNMKYFSTMAWLPKTADAAPTPATGSFAVTGDMSGKVLTGEAQAKSELPQLGGVPTQH